MKSKFRSAISKLLTLGGAFLLATVFANAAPPGESLDSLGEKSIDFAWDNDWDSDRHFGRRHGISLVVGSANFIFDDSDIGGSAGYLKRIYTVVENWRRVRGHIRVDYYEQYGDEVFEATYVIRADCLEVDKNERIAWIGGEVVDVTTNFGIPEVGWWIVNKVDDNDGGNPLNPDMHGSAWLIPETCEDRPEPFFWDPSHRGKVVVR